VVLSNAYDIVEGIAVDTHVGRLAGRLGLSAEATPEKIEQDLMRVLAREEWRFTNHALIAHGRAICQARKPNCAACMLVDICPTGLNQQA
jgi:endonuclease-3